MQLPGLWLLFGYGRILLNTVAQQKKQFQLLPKYTEKTEEPEKLQVWGFGSSSTDSAATVEEPPSQSPQGVAPNAP